MSFSVTTEGRDGKFVGVVKLFDVTVAESDPDPSPYQAMENAQRMVADGMRSLLRPATIYEGSDPVWEDDA